MKKVVFVTNLLPHYQIDFFNRLVDISHDIELTVFANISENSDLNNANDIFCNFNVVNFSLKNFKGVVFRNNLNGLRRKIDDIDPDYLIFYGNPREISLTALMFFYWMTGRVFYVHGMFHRIGGQNLLSKLYYRFVGMIASKCLVYSRKGAEVLLGLGVKHNKIKIIGTALDEEKHISYANNINNESLIKFKKDNSLLNKKVVLQVVRLSKIKKPELILSVAKKLSKVRSDIVFVLVGGGELYSQIKDDIKKHELDGIVLLLGSIYDNDQLSYWFKSANVFVVPTCIGLSAHHAFSYSLPIVTDDNLLEQASEFDILSDGLNSLLYESGNVESFKNKILEILDDEDLQLFLSKNALYTVSRTHSLDVKCNNYLSVLQEASFG